MAQSNNEGADDPPPSLRTLLLAGTALLQPPSPLPASPPELLGRLKTSSARLPLSWRSTRSEWSADTELEQVGDEDSSNAVRRKIRRDDLVMVVAKRSLSLLVGVQGWLEKECWPESLRLGLKPSDYMLGGNDNKLIQLLVSHTVSSLLLQLSITYEAHLKTNNGHQTAQELSSALVLVLSLLAPPRVPPQPCGPSSIPRGPYTTISTTLHTKHLANILLSCILLAYTPTTEPAVHLKLRQLYMHTLNQITPTNTLVALGGTLQILLSGQKEKSPVRGWFRPWPAYVIQTVKQTMSAQITKPGGPRALIAYMFTDPANTSSADERRLEIISKTLMALPKGQTEETYLPRLLDDLLMAIGFVDAKPPPQIYVHAAAYTIFKLWEKYREVTQKWMSRIIVFPSDPEGLARDSSTPLIATNVALRIVNALRALIMYAPPTHAYLAYLLTPNLHPLFTLFTYRYMSISASEIRQVNRGKAKSSDSSHNAAGVLLMLDTWLRVASAEEAVEALWEIIVGDSIWKRSFEREKALAWDGPIGKEQVIIKSTRAAEPISVKRDDPSDMTSVLRGITIDPEPDAFVALLKSIERPEVASEIFLKLLNQWRTAHNARNGPRLLAVQFLRMVSRILETFGAKLLTTPEHLLLFVEGTLFDAIDAGPEPKPKVEMAEADVDHILTDADEIDQLSPVDISLRLMLAILAGLDSTPEIETLLLPISSHVKRLAAESTSTEIKSLAEEVIEKIKSSHSPQSKPAPTASEAFQKAVELLHDPILPVRAHGLAMLSDIVKDPFYDRRMNREILSEFKKALWTEDSFVYLQASKHLASMVYVLGPEIFRGVWILYQEAVEDTRNGTDDKVLDRVLRVGETVDVVINTLGKAFSIHGEHIDDRAKLASTVIPRLRAICATAKLPSIVRGSALAILSSSISADYLSLLPCARELLSDLVDLLQVESVRDSPFKPIIIPPEVKPAKPKVVLIEDDEPELEPEPLPVIPLPRTVDEEPTKPDDGKHPVLRRAAVSLLDSLFDRLLTVLYEFQAKQLLGTGSIPSLAQAASPFDPNSILGYDIPILQSALTPLLYIADTDIDESTRAQATTAAASASALIDMMPITTL